MEQLEGDTYRLYDIGGQRETRAHASALKLANQKRFTVAEDLESDLPAGYAFVEAVLGHEVRDQHFDFKSSGGGWILPCGFRGRRWRG